VEERHDDIRASTSCGVEGCDPHSKVALMPKIICSCLLLGSTSGEGSQLGVVRRKPSLFESQKGAAPQS
jgi:hypothetical protein